MLIFNHWGVVTVKIALGMIIKNLVSDAVLMRFIENAEKYGHKLECVIVAYSHKLDPQVGRNISEKVPFHAVNVYDPRYCAEELAGLGVSGPSAETLLRCPVDMSAGLVPYGYNRNIVMIEAMLRGMDVLFFVDYDVEPYVLNKTAEGFKLEEVDFFGAHIEHLSAGSQITTGEYSGYNILPPASFDGMEDLLHGLQKPEMLEYWQSSGEHRCLAYQRPVREPKPCNKILGGNAAIKLSAMSELPPFFSSYYTLGDELFLCRGEDTILGLSIAKSGTVCTDIALNPLHDAYKDYPAEPDLLGDKATQDRFYYACTGWVGRNPFLNYMRGGDPVHAREFQREKLRSGMDALAGYTGNPRYLSVLDNFDVSWDSLGRYISEYERVLGAWEELVHSVKGLV